MKRKLMCDLINQLQIMTSACEAGHHEMAQAAIDKTRKLLDGLEMLCGQKQEVTPIDKQQKAS
jgi:hypothetical protein